MPIIRPKDPFPFLVRAGETAANPFAPILEDSAAARSDAVDPVASLDATDQAALQAYVQNYSIPGDIALSPLGTENQTYSAEFTKPPKNWTWLNQGTSTVAYNLSRAIITPQAGGAGTNAPRVFGPGVYLTAPWCVRVRMGSAFSRAGDGGGVGVYHLANDDMHTFNVYRRLAPGGAPFTETWAALRWFPWTTLNLLTDVAPVTADERSGDRYLQVRCDGTSLFYDYSSDNAGFVNWATITLPLYLGVPETPLRVGVFANCPNTAPTVGFANYDWFRVYLNANLNQ